MSTKRYLPSKKGKKVIWLNNFAAKLPIYARKYKISNEDIETVKKNAVAFSFWVDYSYQLQKYTKRINAFVTNLATGKIEPTTSPESLIMPTAPAIALAGIFGQISILVSVIKKNPAYTFDDGVDLGIEGIGITAQDVTDIKPRISVRIITDGHPEIVWRKGIYQGVEIQVDRGNGTWQFLAVDLKPNYTDLAQLPEVGKSEVWRYRIIYIEDSNHIGMWSDTVEIAVKGI